MVEGDVEPDVHVGVDRGVQFEHRGHRLVALVEAEGALQSLGDHTGDAGELLAGEPERLVGTEAVGHRGGVRHGEEMPLQAHLVCDRTQRLCAEVLERQVLDERPVVVGAAAVGSGGITGRGSAAARVRAMRTAPAGSVTGSLASSITTVQ